MSIAHQIQDKIDQKRVVFYCARMDQITEKPLNRSDSIQDITVECNEYNEYILADIIRRK